MGTETEGLECGNCRLVFSAGVNHSTDEAIMDNLMSVVKVSVLDARR